MLLNEHKSKLLFQESGVPVPEGETFDINDINSKKPGFPLPWFLKAQALTGGRGKAGGIKRVDKEEDFTATAKSILTMPIKGHSIPLLRVEPAAEIEREFYLSLTVSRADRCLLLTVGREGGVEIENLGSDNLLCQKIYLPDGLQGHQVRAAFFHLGLGKELFKPFAELLSNLYKATLDKGLLLAEINPLILTADQRFVALDGKVEVDDNMVDIDPELERFYQPEHASDEENIAREAGLSFVSMEGWVGLMANGAGLAMATMDLLNYSGLPASNFLDLGGAANRERMKTALDLLFGDKRVGALFINLFGGILSCEKVAEAISMALDGKAPKKPIVARLSGNGAEAGLKILDSLNQKDIHIAQEMSQALELLNKLKPENAPAIEFKTPEIDGAGSAAALDPDYIPGKIVFDIDKNTPILVQGITGKEGRLHTELMLEYGSNIVAGVTPFKGGQKVLGVPVYDSVRQAAREHEIGASIIFVPPKMAADAILEAAGSDIPWAVCITEGIVQHQMLSALTAMRNSSTRLVGPNTPGIIVPGQTKIGILPQIPFTPGPVAILSRSGTLTYEAAARMTAASIGQSMCMGIGGDPFIGTTFVDMFEMLRNHEPTRAVLVLGEIGGQAEEDLARFVTETGFDKPVLSFISGQTAPPGKRLGHAGAILEKGGGIGGKLGAMQAAGFIVCPTLEDIPELTRQALKG